VNNLQVIRCGPRGSKGSRIHRVRVKGYGTKTTLDYIRMLYISYGSVCELETQILLAGDLGFIEKGELGTAKKDIAEIERMLKALIKSLENKHLNP
jgi:four helix bundle protein